MLPPQGADEVAPVVEALRLIDDRLDVVWNPRAVVVRRGGYDATGKMIDPAYDGRWEVLLRDPSTKTSEWREHTRLFFVTPRADAARNIPALQHDGPYAPIGPWLVDYVRALDAWNREEMRRVSAAIDAHTAAAEARIAADEVEAAREAVERVYIENTIRGGVSDVHPNRLPAAALPSA